MAHSYSQAWYCMMKKSEIKYGGRLYLKGRISIPPAPEMGKNENN